MPLRPRAAAGLTLIEILAVLVLLGLVLGLAAPSFLSPRRKSDDTVQQVIETARRAAVQRAEAMTLSFEADGRWVVAGVGEGDSLRLLAGTVDWPYESTLRLRISPLGACMLDSAQGPEPALTVDHVRCRLSER
jgi:prepilin-type N-terminal cleavage/methylation domain-containing protein